MTYLANIETLSGQLGEAALSGSQPSVGQWINGRIVAVLGSPELTNTEDLAIGVSVLNAGTSTPQHDHRAEEIAIVLDGVGQIALGDQVINVTKGDVIRTPPHVPHQTFAAADSQLRVLWIYAPAGSERRWLDQHPAE